MTAPIITNLSGPSNPLPWHASPHDYSGDNQLANQAQEPIQRYVCGTRYTTWDGRVFKYGHAVGASEGGKGARNHSGVGNIAQDAAKIIAGDKFITLTLDSGDGFGADGTIAENELAGAYLTSHHPTVQNRGIIGNTGGYREAIKIYLDSPISFADADPFIEIILNPYLYLRQHSSGTWLSFTSVMCVPSSNIEALNYFWGQTWGPCWVSPGMDSDSIGDTAEERNLYWGGDGTVCGGLHNSGGIGGEQLAGFIIDETAETNDAYPCVMLQLSI